MIQKDLDQTNHIVFFSIEDINNGYHYCDAIMKSIEHKFPDHTFIGLPDTVIIKELGKEAVQDMISELQNYLELISKEEKSNE